MLCQVRYSAVSWQPLVQPFPSEHRSTGFARTLNTAPGSDGVIATIELDEHTDLSALPDGIYAQVAVYSDHFNRLSR